VELCGSAKRLAWAKANGCPWGEVTCAFLARRGRLEALQWAREHDGSCPWDARTSRGAAAGGHLVGRCRFLTVSKPELKALGPGRKPGVSLLYTRKRLSLPS
jgi:hypothetical protein